MRHEWLYLMSGLIEVTGLIERLELYQINKLIK